MTRSSRTYSRAVPEANFDECLRHMLQLAGLAVPLPGSLNLTFYASNNFIASRRRLRNSPRAAWSALADQFVAQGVCVPRALRSATANATEAAGCGSSPRTAAPTRAAAAVQGPAGGWATVHARSQRLAWATAPRYCSTPSSEGTRSSTRRSAAPKAFRAGRMRARAERVLKN